MHRVLIGVLSLGIAAVTSGQSTSVAFDVASVKPSNSNSGSASTDDSPGGYTATNMSLRRLIAFAYRMHPVLDRDRIVGPAWIDSARFDINARTPEGTTRAQVPDMLRTLLVDRFTLSARLETKEAPVYALVVARADRRLGAQLTPSILDCSKSENLSSGTIGVNLPAPGQRPTKCGLNSVVDGNGGVLSGGALSMPQLAAGLTGRVNRPVIDRTGLTGTYDFVLRWAPENATAAGLDTVTGASIFTALQDQLGLKLDPQSGPAEFLVIDRIERPSPD